MQITLCFLQMGWGFRRKKSHTNTNKVDAACNARSCTILRQQRGENNNNKNVNVEVTERHESRWIWWKFPCILRRTGRVISADSDWSWPTCSCNRGTTFIRSVTWSRCLTFWKNSFMHGKSRLSFGCITNFFVFSFLKQQQHIPAHLNLTNKIHLPKSSLTQKAACCRRDKNLNATIVPWVELLPLLQGSKV